MGFISGIIKSPFKAVGDIVGGITKPFRGAIENVLNAGKQFLTGHPIEAFKTLLKAPFQAVGDIFTGSAQALRGGIGLVGSVVTIGGIAAAPFTGGLSLLPALLSHGVTGYR